MNARAIITILLTAWIMIVPNSATAHPLGNFSISHYSGIRVSKDAIELRYMIDMAEIPTFQEIQESGIEPKAGDPSLEAYLARKAEILRDGLALEVNGKPLVLRAESREIIFPPGAGGLPTMKVGFRYKAKLIGDSKAAEYLISYRDGNFPGRAGWKEVIAVAGSDARILNSSVPEIDRSSQLNDYPTDLLNSPPQELEARVAFITTAVPASVASTASSRIDAGAGEKARPVSKAQVTLAEVSQSSSKVESVKQPGDTRIVNSAVIDADSTEANENSSVQLQANRQATPRNSFTELIATEQLGLGIILIALGVAAGLGAFHALEPGHGKTLVAAYLVGSRGTVQHAFLLGLIVTAAHTAGVYLLGAVTLYASQYIVPERLYPWLGVVSGVLIAGLGAVLLVRRYRGKDGLSNHHHHHHRDHSHGPDDHDHHQHHHHHHHRHEHGHSHDLGHMHRDHDLDRQVSLRELLTLGISGGIVPCPAALVVLLSAVSMQRIGFGLLLIVAFSVGLAAVLITIGLLMVSARQFMSRFQVNSRLTTRWLPLTSSAFILVFGIALAVQALQTAGILFIQL
jgi:ABC-type nickel/cobalt efflux system permease component RcnA